MVQPPYGEAVRLISVAAEAWDLFEGKYTSQGIDPLQLSLRKFLNLIYFTLLEATAGDEGKAVKMKQELAAPLPGRAHKVSQQTIDSEMAMFKKAAGMA